MELIAYKPTCGSVEIPTFSNYRYIVVSNEKMFFLSNIQHIKEGEAPEEILKKIPQVLELRRRGGKRGGFTEVFYSRDRKELIIAVPFYSFLFPWPKDQKKTLRVLSKIIHNFILDNNGVVDFDTVLKFFAPLNYEFELYEYIIMNSYNGFVSPSTFLPERENPIFKVAESGYRYGSAPLYPVKKNPSNGNWNEVAWAYYFNVVTPKEIKALINDKGQVCENTSGQPYTKETLDYWGYSFYLREKETGGYELLPEFEENVIKFGKSIEGFVVPQ